MFLPARNLGWSSLSLELRHPSAARRSWPACAYLAGLGAAAAAVSRFLPCARAGETLLSRSHNYPEACGGAHAMQEWDRFINFVYVILAVAVVVAVVLEFVPIF